MVNIKIVSLNENGGVVSSRLFAVREGTILNALIQAGVTFHAPCGGKALCHKCMVKVAYKDQETIVQSCVTPVREGMSIFLKDEKAETQGVASLSTDVDYAMCLDLGTTTLVFYIVDVEAGNIVYEESMKNPQSIFGADVMSRIAYANVNGVKELFFSINDAVRNELSKFASFNITKLFVCGNPTMLHIFYNCSVKSLGEYPYSPMFLEKKEFHGNALNLPVSDVVLLPSFSSFVGSDISAGVLQTNLTSGNNALIDLGTNGEMVLCYRGKLYATSTSAGPAFEGGNIECGCGATNGAINHFELMGEKMNYTTINDKKPCGITGPALVDLISILKKQKLIDPSGRLLLNDKKHYLTDEIYITQKDIRAFQLAKSAIRTGFELLLSEAGANVDDIDKVYIAGGFGHYLNIDSAVDVGLLPKELKEKYINAGNSAGLGAVAYAIDKRKSKRTFLDEITKQAFIVDLNSNAEFLDRYADNMEI